MNTWKTIISLNILVLSAPFIDHVPYSLISQLLKYHFFHVTNKQLLNNGRFLAPHPNYDLALCPTTLISLKWVNIKEKSIFCYCAVQNNPAETMASPGTVWQLQGLLWIRCLKNARMKREERITQVWGMNIQFTLNTMLSEIRTLVCPKMIHCCKCVKYCA